MLLKHPQGLFSLYGWQYQAITWTNVDFLSGIFIAAITQGHAQAVILYNEFENHIIRITTASPRGW